MTIQVGKPRLNSKAAGSESVRTAILSSRMDGIAQKMQNTLFRTARSGVLNTAHDFSCVIVTPDCRLLARAESLPIHTLIGPDLMCQTVKRYHPDLRAGDCYLHNCPYEGNSHAADHCLIAPIVDKNGVLRFFALAKAHQADCGNSRPSTYLADVADVYEEGALIFSAVKIQENYRNNEDVVRMCRNRIRVPEQWWGDYLASLGAVRIAERELLALGEEVGWDVLEFLRRGLVRLLGRQDDRGDPAAVLRQSRDSRRARPDPRPTGRHSNQSRGGDRRRGRRHHG